MAAIVDIERAMRLDPTYTEQALQFLGSAHLIAGQFAAAVSAFRKRIRLAPKTDISRALLASALGHLGEANAARLVWDELKVVNPRYSFEEHWGRLPFQDPADAGKIRAGLAKAGLPD